MTRGSTGRTAAIDALRWSTDRAATGLALAGPEQVAEEEPLEIRLRHGSTVETVSVTMRTPGDDADLAAGFLFAEGVLHRPEQVERIDVPADGGDQVVEVVTRELVSLDPSRRRQFFVNSSCGVCGRSLVKGLYAEFGGPVRSSIEVPGPWLVSLPSSLRGLQPLFDRTGGVHAAALVPAGGRPVEVAEDVGRHNAVDKVIGRRFLGGRLPASESVLQVSGRVSFEIIEKAAAAGIPVVSAVSAPTSLAVTAADRWGITLAAFVRDGRLTLYSHPERVVDAAGRPLRAD